MVELLTLGSLAFAAMVVVGVLASVFGTVIWMVFVPFKLLGWMLRGLGLLLFLPVVAIFGVVAVVVLGAGVLMFLLPFLPLALLAAGAWWLVRRVGGSGATVTG